MAYGNIVDYEEGPAPGSYAFTRADGSKMMFVGPAAEDLKSKVDAAKAVGPQPTGGLGPNVNAPKNVASDVVAPVPGAAPSGKNWAGMFTGAVPVGGAPQGFGGPPPAPQPGATQEAGPLAGFKSRGLGVYEGADGRLYEYKAPTAGSKGGMVERSRTVSGGFDPNEEYLQRKEDNYLGEQAAIATGMEAAKEQAAEQKAFFEEQQRQMMVREEEARAQKAQIDRGVSDLEAKHQAAMKEYAGAKVNPNKAMGGGKNWIFALSAGLGTFGSAMAKSPNTTIQIIEQRIADNIRAQEAEIAVKRDTANNALADLTRKMGSQELARKALADVQLEQFKLEMQKQASATSDKELEAKYLMMANAAESKQLDFREQYRQAAAGQITKSIVNVPGSAGSRGGLVPVGNQLGTAQGLATLEKTQADAAGAGKSDGPGSADKQKQLAAIKAARAGLDDLELTDVEGGRGMVLRTGIGASDTSQALGSQTEALAPTLGRALEGNAPNESTMDSIRSGLSSASGAKRKQAIDAYRKQLDAAEAALNE